MDERLGTAATPGTVCALLHAHAEQLVRTSASVFVVDLEHLPADQHADLGMCLSRARSASWSIVALAVDPDAVPTDLRSNLGTALHATTTSHIDAGPFTSTSPSVWHLG